MSKIAQPTFFLSHGGGPWPWLIKDMPFMNGLHGALVKVAKSLSELPQAIVIVSGHWEENKVEIMSSEQPGMIYDYSGFPEHTYKIKYSAPGNPQLAQRIKDLFEVNGIKSNLNNERGYDHGVYSLLYPMFPNADIPIVQVSLRSDFDPKSHVEMGKALKPLREEGVLIIGSGNLFHNMSTMQNCKKESYEFDQWMREVLLSKDINYRTSELIEWEKAPYARFCQPREDHLAPLFVTVGAAGDDLGELVYGEPLFGRVSVSSFKFSKDTK